MARARLLFGLVAIVSSALAVTAAACVGDDPSIAVDPVDAQGADAPFEAADAAEAAVDADAGPPVPTGARRWVQPLVPPTGGFVFPTALAVSATDEVVVVGLLQAGAGGGTFDFGNGKTTTVSIANNEEGFIAKFDAQGKCAWVLSVSGTGTELPSGVAIGAAGEIVVLAVTDSATVTVASTPAARPGNAGGDNLLVVKLQANGTLVWHKIYGGPGTDEPGAIAVRPDGHIALGAQFVRANGADNIDFGPVSITYPPSPADVAGVVLLNPTGDAVWARALPQSPAGIGTDRNTVRTIAFDSKGDVLAGGDFNPTIDFRYPPGEAPINFTSAGSEDAWFGKFAGSNGRTSWAQRIGATGQNRTAGIAVDALDNVVVTGTYMAPGPVTVGGTNMPIYGGVDVFLAKIDPAGSSFEWARGFGGPVFQNATGVKLDPWGNVVVAGRQAESVDWAGKKTTGGGGGDDGYIAHVSSDALSGHWALGLGSSGNDDLLAFGVGPTSGISAVAGTLQGPATLAGASVAIPDGGTGSYAYVLVLAP